MSHRGQSLVPSSLVQLSVRCPSSKLSYLCWWLSVISFLFTTCYRTINYSFFQLWTTAIDSSVWRLLLSKSTLIGFDKNKEMYIKVSLDNFTIKIKKNNLLWLMESPRNLDAAIDNKLRFRKRINFQLRLVYEKLKAPCKSRIFLTLEIRELLYNK